MTSNLKYPLTANTNAIGVNHNTNETFTFNTGAACETDGSCIMNGNTVMTEQVTNGGYYYSWYAATAGTGTASMSSGDATGSICPKGWRLPANYTSNPDKSYGGITLAYLGFYINKSVDYHLILESAPLQFVRSGNYFGGGFHNVNLGGYALSSTASATGSNYLLAYSTTVSPSRTDPQFSYYKYVGFPVRCVAR